jgi:hypothetical protein
VTVRRLAWSLPLFVSSSVGCDDPGLLVANEGSASSTMGDERSSADDDDDDDDDDNDDDDGSSSGGESGGCDEEDGCIPECPPEWCDAGPAFNDGIFPIGVFVQPVDMFDLWKSRGVNTVVGTPDGHSVTEWNDAAMARDLFVVRPPLGDPAADAENPLVLAWLMRDEPDIEGEALVGALQSLYADLKAAAPEQPVFVNFAGWNIMEVNDSCNGPGDDGPFTNCYPQYIAAADWVGQDNYPVTVHNTPDDLALVGRTMDRLGDWAEGRPMFAYIETSDTNTTIAPLSNRGVRPAELRAELWNAIIHRSRGLFLFTVAFGPWEFDATPPDVAEELTVQTKRIHELAPVLQTRIDPPGIGIELDAPLEATWRGTPAGKYFFVLHLPSCFDPDTCPSATESFTLTGIGDAETATVHGEDREVAIDESGTITDDFAAYELHVYVVR